MAEGTDGTGFGGRQTQMQMQTLSLLTDSKRTKATTSEFHSISSTTNHWPVRKATETAILLRVSLMSTSPRIAQTLILLQSRPSTSIEGAQCTVSSNNAPNCFNPPICFGFTSLRIPSIVPAVRSRVHARHRRPSANQTWDQMTVLSTRHQT